MRLLLKILLVLMAVAVLPVAVSGVTSIVLAKDAVRAAQSDKLETEARHLAELAETTILGGLDDLRQAANLNLASLDDAELSGALWVIYRADAARAAVALVDGTTGVGVVPPVFQSVVGADEGLAEHEAFPAEALQAFAEHIPLAEAMSAGKAVSVPYADAVRGTPLIAIAVRVPGRTKDGKPQSWVIAAEVSLRALNARFAEANDEKLRAFLVDLEGRAVCHTDVKQALARTALKAHPGVQALMQPKAPASGLADYDDDAGALVLAAFARAGRLAAPDGKTWGVVVERDGAVALSALKALSTRTTFWVGTALILALCAGFVLARGIARPLEALSSVVKRFGKDDTLRAPVQSKDEIGALSTTFNRMADQIAERDRQLRSFNEELQHKVDDRTRELKEAQNQLIQSQKMAAVGELGAGVAHEINNPLAAVLGSAQLALLRLERDDTKVRPILQDIEREGLRIRDIVESLLKLSQDQSQLAMGTVDVNTVVDGAVALMARPIIAQRIHVKKELATNPPKIRGRSAELQQAVMQLLMNAKDAMPDGGTLTVRTEAVDDRLVKIVVEDTGSGVPEQNRERIFEPFFTTRASKGHKGMGLAIVHRTVEEHGGRVAVDQSPGGKGAVLRLTFPATRDTLHLR